MPNLPRTVQNITSNDEHEPFIIAGFNYVVALFIVVNTTEIETLILFTAPFCL